MQAYKWRFLLFSTKWLNLFFITEKEISTFRFIFIALSYSSSTTIWLHEYNDLFTREGWEIIFETRHPFNFETNTRQLIRVKSKRFVGLLVRNSGLFAAARVLI